MYTKGKSVYTSKFDDRLGVFFDEESFPGIAEAILEGDVSKLLQQAILDLVKEQQYGILYIPEGEYPLAKTVMVPRAVRLIGYGQTRPVFVLPENATGFESSGDLSHMPGWGENPDANYMIWFIANYGPFDPNAKEGIQDANAGTFYSGLSNIDFRIEGNHPSAVCIRAHFAQHGFITHSNFCLGTGLAAVYDVGNEMEDLTVEGGQYGLLCRMTSPGWPFMIVDCKFENQKKAAFLSSECGFTGLRLEVSDTEIAFACWDENRWEKLYLEDCEFRNIRKTVITSSESGNVGQQMNVKNIRCKNVGDFLYQIDTGRRLNLGKDYLVKEYTKGYQLSDIDAKPQICEKYEVASEEDFTQNWAMPQSDIPLLGAMKDWVSVLSFGAVGDGKTDDTHAFQKALDSGKIIYMPQGMYRISDTLVMAKDSSIIGMHPATTQLVILDDEEKFADFGTPIPLIKVEKGVRAIINGIGVDTAAKNPRACGILWSANEFSYMNDVKFMGGHGMMYRDGSNPFDTLYNPSRTADFYPERKWDYQYASLWISEGGGIFKDVWSCSPYAEAGIAITDTKQSCRMYAISLEHHVRHEIKIHRVENLKIYALQTEEEKAEGTYCLPMEIVSSSDIELLNYYLFRVIAVDEPYETGIRVWNSKKIYFRNLRNMAQMQYTFTLNLKDETTGFVAKSPDYAMLTISGEAEKTERKSVGKYTVLANGFSFAQGATVDKEGNLYWCDKKKKTIYCYEVAEDVVYPLIDIHYTPSAIAFDSKGRMIVTVDYSKLKEKAKTNPFDDHDRSDPHPFFSWFYKRGEKVYSIDRKHPFSTMKELEKVRAREIEDIKKYSIIRCMELDYPGFFKEVMGKNIEEYYLALDNATLVEATKDLARATGLATIKVGEKTAVTDDFLKKSYEFEVLPGGSFKDGRLVADRGQYGAVLDENGMYLTIEDRLYAFSNGKLITSSDVPWDAYTIRLAKDIIYVIGRNSIYMLSKKKKVIFLGSSITYGEASGGVSFAEILSEKYDWKMIKEAVSGTTLVDKDEQSYISRMKTIETDTCDLFICQLSTNDANLKLPIQDVEDAIRYIIQYAKERWNCPIAFYSNPRYDNQEYEKMVALMKSIANEEGIIYINMWDDKFVNDKIEANHDYYMADAIHPTLAGYKEVFVPCMEGYKLLQ